MSTKINVRSPFYLNLTEPVVPEPLFDCDTANIKNLTIDQQGQINYPNLDYGTVISITSTDSDFSNDKYSTVSTATDRNLTVRINIPAGFSNVADGYIDCDKVVSQPALILTQPTPSDPPVSCSAGPTSSGSIPSQTIDVDGDSETIDLSSYFTQGNVAIAAYSVYNPNPSLIATSVTGSNLTITSNAIGGSTTLQVSASDDEANSCTATQSISVTVSNPSVAFDCTQAAFSGGSIAVDGTIVKPDSVASVGNIKASAGGSTITSHTANNTGSDRSVTLFFDLTAPAGYSNAGSTVECSKAFTQPAALPAFTCDTASLSGQQISSNGTVRIGTAQLGTISSYSPLSFSTVTSDTSRTVTFTITIPSGYSNSGTIDCDKTITQPADIPVCGANSFEISTALPAPSDFCTGLFAVRLEVKTTASSIETALGHVVCEKGRPKLGGGFYYAVSEFSTNVGTGTGKFFLWKIDDGGVIQDVAIRDCPAGVGTPQGRGGSL